MDPSERTRAYAAGIASRVHAVKQGFARAFIDAVIPATPYKTGRARAGWIVGNGERPAGEGNEPDPSGASAIAAAYTAIDASQPGEPIHLTNNVPYIGELNSGSSEQAPAGFVELAYNQARQLVPAVKAEVAQQK